MFEDSEVASQRQKMAGSKMEMRHHRALIVACLASNGAAFTPGKLLVRPGRASTRVGVVSLTAETPLDAEVVVVGSGLAGLCCGALLAHSGITVTVLEAHDAAGGAIHTWERRGFHFESGPSLYSGFSQDRSPNPLKVTLLACLVYIRLRRHSWQVI